MIRAWCPRPATRNPPGFFAHRVLSCDCHPFPVHSGDCHRRHPFPRDESSERVRRVGVAQSRPPVLLDRRVLRLHYRRRARAHLSLILTHGHTRQNNWPHLTERIGADMHRELWQGSWPRYGDILPRHRDRLPSAKPTAKVDSQKVAKSAAKTPGVAKRAARG